VPFFLARIVRRCLRAKPARRPATAQRLRVALERRLGHPSPADCRSILAAWLWDSQIFRARKNETVVRLTPSLPGSGFNRLRWAVVGTAGLVVVLAVLVYLLPPASLRYVPEAIVDPVKSAPVPDAAELFSQFQGGRRADATDTPADSAEAAAPPIPELMAPRWDENVADATDHPSRVAGEEPAGKEREPAGPEPRPASAGR
jgi:hypothetical protein